MFIDSEWCCLTFGSMVCIDCSGIHRSLGVHRSKVRSLRLDHWDDDSLIIMRNLGNELVNKIYEPLLTPSLKPVANSLRKAKEKFIYDKYIKRSFIPLENDDSFSADLVSFIYLIFLKRCMIYYFRS